MRFLPSGPNLLVVAAVIALTAWYVIRNWDCFYEKYRVAFLAASVVEIIVLAYQPLALLGVALLMSAMKSKLKRSEYEGDIRDFPSPFHLIPGKFWWHYTNSMGALFFSGIVHLAFKFFQ